MSKINSSYSSEIELGNIQVSKKEMIQDKSVVINSTETTSTRNHLGRPSEVLNNGSDPSSNGVVTRHPYYLLLSILLAIIILILSGALTFYIFKSQKLSEMLQDELLTLSPEPTFCRTNEGTHSGYTTKLRYADIVKGRGAHMCHWGGVVGGNYAQPADFPHQVYFAGSKIKCGGSILNKDFVLTAAHCFFTSNGTWRDSSCSWRVVGGDTNLNKTEGTEQIRNISIIYTHPGFRSGSPKDDIALVKLSRPFEFNQFVNSPLLPTHNFSQQIPFYTQSALYVSGYGDLSYKGIRPTILQSAYLDIQTTSECQAAYSSDTGEGIEITDKMICAGGWGRDSCQGDSGGPLSFKRCGSSFSDYVSVLVGVVSGGIECGGMEYPGVYTKVSAYLDWIQNSIENALIWKNSAQLGGSN